ncbi:unnamed protein product, partial [Laminaria digitata]
MAPKTREERLFGAACLRVTLERNGGSAMNEIYNATLDDLGLEAEDVDTYLETERVKV